MTELNVTILI